MFTMTRRIPTDHDRIRLREALREVSWQYARLLSGLDAGDPPRSPFDDTALDADGQRAAVVAHLAALHDLKQMAEELIELTVTVAGETGAAAPELGGALGGVSGSAVRKRFPGAVVSRPGRPGADRASWTDTGRDAWPGLADDPVTAFSADQFVQRYAPDRNGEE